VNDSVPLARIATSAGSLNVRRPTGPAFGYRDNVVHRQLLSFFANSALPFLPSTDLQPFLFGCFSSVPNLFCVVKTSLQKPMASLFFQVLEIVATAIAFPEQPVLGIFPARSASFSDLIRCHLLLVLRLPATDVGDHLGFIFSVVPPLFCSQALSMLSSVLRSLPINLVAVDEAIVGG